MEHDDDWQPIKEIIHMTGIDFLWTDPHQDDMNDEDFEALEYLEQVGIIIHRIERDHEDDNRVTSCHITFRRFDNHLERENYDPDRQKEAFYTAMNLQNFSVNMFYSLQFSFLFEDTPVEDLEEEDPLLDWFMDWWKIYGLSPLIMNPYSLAMLKIQF